MGDAGSRTFVIIGTAGHVDHGKTTLVRALTGVDTDRLPEEKARGISIELGFAYASLARDGDTEPVGFIDVPGHRRFVQTMIAGAAGVDVGLLVVAADDGPMPQTREHVDILRWLGVRRLVVALSKVDRVDDARRSEVVQALDGLLDDTPYRGSPIVPVSATAHLGLDALKAALLAHRVERRVDDGRRFRLAIDRAFVLQGIGLVVTGTCFAGRVAIDDRLTLLPGGLDARVRTIHAQNRSVDAAHAGQRVALNLAGRGIEKSTVHRGDWIVDPAVALTIDRADVALVDGGGAFDERHWRGVRFHAGAASCNARVVLFAARGPEPVLAQIAFDRPIHLLAGDRFVLRDGGADGSAASVAGGIVLDVDVPARGRRGAARLDLLAVAAGDDAARTLVHAIGASAKGVDLAHWNRLHNTTFDAAAVSRLMSTAGGPFDGEARTILFSVERWDALLARIVEVLAAEHRRVPDAVGPGRDRLRRMAAPSVDPTTFSTMLLALKADGRVVQTGAWLHLCEHRVELSADDRRRFDAARALLAAAEPYNPPRVRDIAKAMGDDEAAIRNLFVRLASQGEVYRVAHDHYFLPETVRALAGFAADVAAVDGVARAAAFRDRIGVGRKVSIQILEFFDRVGYTRRHGDEHRVIQPTLFDA